MKYYYNNLKYKYFVECCIAIVKNRRFADIYRFFPGICLMIFKMILIIHAWNKSFRRNLTKVIYPMIDRNRKSEVDLLSGIKDLTGWCLHDERARRQI